MYCPKCGHEVKENDIFCPYCGHQLRKIDERSYKRRGKGVSKDQFDYISNIVVNSFALLFLVFAIISLFGPILSFYNSGLTDGIGSLYWFLFQGLEGLKKGTVAIGPYYTSLSFYIFTSIVIIGLGTYSIYLSINSIVTKKRCQAIPLIIIMIIVHHIYSAIINDLFYIYFSNPTSYSNPSSGWGESVFNALQTPLFIAFAVNIIGRVAFEKNTKKLVFTILSLFLVSTLLNQITNPLTFLGTFNIEYFESTNMGILKYASYVIDETNMEVNSILVAAHIVGIIYIGLVIAHSIYIIRDIYKGNEFGYEKYLIFASIEFLMMISMYVIEGFFAYYINFITAFSDEIYSITSSLGSITFASIFSLTLSTIMFCLRKNKKGQNKVIDMDPSDVHDYYSDNQ